MTELKPVFTVSELNEYVDLMLSRDPFMGELTVTGEISAFKRHTSGHLYFTLKDDAASVRCVMFRPNALRLSFFPKDGMSVRIEGRAGLYGRDGSFQVYAERMEKTGDGALYQKFLALREELKGRGWFDESLKKPIPFLPRAVGVVTSGTGAAIEDIRNVIARRFPNMPIRLYPVAVQGEKAAGEIAAAIRQADQEQRCDVLIVGRIVFAEDVVATIAFLAASEVEGVHAMIGTTMEGLSEKLGKKNYTKGVKVEVGTEECACDITIVVKYGYRIQEVAQKVQQEIKNAIETMTGLKVVEVNVNVNGIYFEPEKKEEPAPAPEPEPVAEEPEAPAPRVK